MAYVKRQIYKLYIKVKQFKLLCPNHTNQQWLAHCGINCGDIVTTFVSIILGAKKTRFGWF